MFVRYGRTGYWQSRRTLSRVQVGEIFTRTSVLGRLVAFAAVGGVLAAAMVVPIVAANAVLVIEDSRYWQHGAIDLRGTIRAAMNDIQHKPVQGGSTIAQQYVKNILLLAAELADNSQAAQAANAETLNRKLNELRMAVAAEHQESKQDILAGYLNDAYFGNNAYGIEAAAETYFGTSAAKLTVTQAATLAGIGENPSAYDPHRNPG